MIDELAKKIASQLHMQCDDADSMEQVLAAVLRSELAKAAGCELLSTRSHGFRSTEFRLLSHDIDLLLIQLAAARERMKRMQDAVDDFFEPEPESIREKNIDAIMEAFRTDQEPKRIEMTPEEMEAAEKNFAAFDRLKAFSKYAQEASDDTRNT